MARNFLRSRQSRHAGRRRRFLDCRATRLSCPEIQDVRQRRGYIRNYHVNFRRNISNALCAASCLNVSRSFGKNNFLTAVVSVGSRKRNINRSHRLLRRTATWPGDSGGGQCVGRFCPVYAPLPPSRARPVRSPRRVARSISDPPEDVDLCLVRISQRSPPRKLRSSRHICDPIREQTTRARFGRGQRLLFAR